MRGLYSLFEVWDYENESDWMARSESESVQASGLIARLVNKAHIGSRYYHYNLYILQYYRPSKL